MPSLAPFASIASAECAIEPSKASSTGLGGLNLVVAAIILWNTAYIERAIRHMRARGEKIPDELLPYLAPLGWQHINLTGDYIWTERHQLDSEGFRPLTAPLNSTQADVLDLSA